MKLRALLVSVALTAACGESVSSTSRDASASEAAVDVAPAPEDRAPPEDRVDVVAPEDAGAPDDVAAEDVPAAEDVVAEEDAPFITGDVVFPTFDVPGDVAADTPTIPQPDAGVSADGGARDAGGDAPRPPGLRELPPVPRYSRGTCPTLRGGPTSDSSVVTGFRTGNATRSFRLLVPRNYDGTREYPLVFAWHWLNASSGSFVRQGELETAVEQMRFIAVLPDSLDSYVFDWPFAEFWGVPAELQFFDDLYACVTQQLRVDRRRVHGIGVSAGGLWLTYLSSTDRANYFASIEVLSGGLGEVPFAWRMQYTAQANKFPAIVLWGGPTDFLGVNFDQASQRLRDELVRDNHFVVQCTHTMGHALPPIAAPPGGGTRFRALWQFFLDHPFGSEPGSSPYFTTGLPADMPSWCSIASRRP